MSAPRDIMAIEAARQAAGISRTRLAMAAGLNVKTLQRAAAGRHDLKPSTLRRLEEALARLKRGHRPADDAALATRAAYAVALVLVCRAAGVAVAEVTRFDPAAKATMLPAWLEAARLRTRAIYLTNVALGVPQHLLAKATCLTPSAITLACRRGEDERDVAELAATLEALEQDMMGAMG